MRLKRLAACTATVAVLGGAMLSAPAMAENDQDRNDQRYSALRAIDANPLSIEEMQQIAGQYHQLSAAIAAYLYGLAARLGQGSPYYNAIVNLAHLYAPGGAIYEALKARH
jgi:hypothetical protein